MKLRRSTKVTPNLQAALDAKSSEVEQLKGEVQHLRILVASLEARCSTSQVLSAEIEGFVSIEQMVPLDALAEAERGGDDLEKRTREAEVAIRAAVVACTAQSSTIGRCYGVVESYTRDFLPIYSSVWRLVSNAEDVAAYGRAVVELKAKLPDAQPTQRTGAPVEAYGDARKVKPLFDEAMRAIGVGTLSLSPTLKRMSRILEKIVLGRCDASCVFDVVRAMFVCDSMDALATVARALASTSSVVVVRVKDRFDTAAPGGWRDLLLNLYLRDDPNRHVCEVQLVHRTMLAARAGLPGHEVYSRTRNANEILEYLGMDEAATNKRGCKWTVASDSVTRRNSLPRTDQPPFLRPSRPRSFEQTASPPPDSVLSDASHHRPRTESRARRLRTADGS